MFIELVKRWLTKKGLQGLMLLYYMLRLQHFCDNIRKHYSFPQQCNALIANALLYNTKHQILKDLAEPTRIRNNFKFAKDLIRVGHQSLDQVMRPNN